MHGGQLGCVRAAELGGSRMGTAMGGREHIPPERRELGSLMSGQ